MGRVTTADAATSEGVEQVILVDRDASRAAEVAAAYAQRRGARAGRGRRRPASPRSPAPTRSSTPPRTGSTCRVMQACLEVGAHYTDLGGLYYYAIEQYELDDGLPARRAVGRDLDGRRTWHHEHAGGGGRGRARHGGVDRGHRRVRRGPPLRPGRALRARLRRRHADRRVHAPGADVHRRARAAHAGRRRGAHLPPARGRRRVRLHDPLRAGHPPPLLRRPRHPQRRVAARACRRRTRCRCAPSWRAAWRRRSRCA